MKGPVQNPFHLNTLLFLQVTDPLCSVCQWLVRGLQAVVVVEVVVVVAHSALAVRRSSKINKLYRQLLLFSKIFSLGLVPT